MRKGNKRFSLSVVISVITIAFVIAVCSFLVYTLVLKTNYKNTALEINEAFRTESTVTVHSGSDSISLSTLEAEYYDKFLLDGNTTVYSRKSVPTTEETITLNFRNEQLSFTGLEDGSAIAVCWKTPADEKHFIVRSQITFIQLRAYIARYLQR